MGRRKGRVKREKSENEEEEEGGKERENVRWGRRKRG